MYCLGCWCCPLLCLSSSGGKKIRLEFFLKNQIKLHVIFVQPCNEDGTFSNGSGLLFTLRVTAKVKFGGADSHISNSSSEVKLEIPQRTYTKEHAKTTERKALAPRDSDTEPSCCKVLACTAYLTQVYKICWVLQLMFPVSWQSNCLVAYCYYRVTGLGKKNTLTACHVWTVK